MSLQFYIGNSGTGKSYALYKKVIEEAHKNQDRQYVVLVPEQFTLQTQKDFVMMSPNRGILNIDILSFERLAYRVFGETGAGNLPVLDEIGKIFVTRKVAEDKKDELVLMGQHLSKIGYINEVKSMISEFIQYDIQGEMLEHLLEENKNRQQIYGKLHDVNVIYQAFSNYLKEKYITSEELLDVLCRIVEKSKLLKGCTLVMDGYTGFTPVQKKLLAKFLTLCRKVWVTVTYDTSMPIKKFLPDYHLFHMSAKMMSDFVDMAEELGVKREPDVVFAADENRRFANNAPMASLEKNLFRIHARPYEEEQDGILVHVCKNPYEEAQFAAREIRRLVMDGRARYGEIAIVTGDLPHYAEYARRVFDSYEIPYFSDYKRSALANPAIACIRSLLECANKDFSYESVSGLWRTGLVPLDTEALDEMQNYILAKGIRTGKRWKEPWQKSVWGMSEEVLEEMNQKRAEFIGPLLPFAKIIRSKKSTVREKTIGLCQLLEQYQVQQQLEQYRQCFEEDGQRALAKEYAQMYAIVVQMLERLVELLGDEKMDGQQYAKLLDAGFAETKVGVIPPGADQVIIGDIERSRLKDIKVLFFLGVNDGVIPKNKSGAGILSELERQTLKEQGAELAPGRQEQYYTQKFYLYLNMTKPRERLYLSYSKVDASGKACNPSYLIRTVLELFPKMLVVDEEGKEADISNVTAPVGGMQYLIAHWREEKDADFYALYRWFDARERYGARLSMLRRVFRDDRERDSIQAALAKALYTNELSGSVTRLETYAACAYAHFLRYGIQAGEREEFGFRGLDFGNILHEVLDLYAKELAKRNLLWTQIEEGEKDALIEWCVQEAVTRNDASVLYYTARDRYRLTRILRIAKRTVWALTRQLEQGKFQPSAYELSFHSIQSIKNGLQEAARLKLRGRIDRMDTYEKDDRVYVKVIDYKTGFETFKLINLYYGTHLQLVVYLRSAIDIVKKVSRGKEVIPAGIVYYHVDDPLVESEEVGEKQLSDIEEKLLKELCVDGRICEDTEVLEAFDRKLADNAGNYSSSVVPVKTNKNGTLSKSSKTMSAEEFQVVMEYADKKMKDMGGAILSGDIRIDPYQDSKRTSCTYCPYQNVCIQEKNGVPMRFRKFEDMKEEEAYARMKMELGEDGE